MNKWAGTQKITHHCWQVTFQTPLYQEISAFLNFFFRSVRPCAIAVFPHYHWRHTLYVLHPPNPAQAWSTTPNAIVRNSLPFFLVSKKRNVETRISLKCIVGTRVLSIDNLRKTQYLSIPWGILTCHACKAFQTYPIRHSKVRQLDWIQLKLAVPNRHIHEELLLHQPKSSF